MTNQIIDKNCILSQNIYLLMKKFNINQKQLSHEIQINPMTLSKWLNGTAYPSSDSLSKVASFFGVTVDSLTNAKDNIDRELEICISVLSPIEKKKVLKLIKILIN